MTLHGESGISLNREEIRELDGSIINLAIKKESVMLIKEVFGLAHDFIQRENGEDLLQKIIWVLHEINGGDFVEPASKTHFFYYVLMMVYPLSVSSELFVIGLTRSSKDSVKSDEKDVEGLLNSDDTNFRKICIEKE